MVDPRRVRVLRPALRIRRPGISMATRKKHTPEQVVRKLAAADRKRCVPGVGDPHGSHRTHLPPRA